LINQRIVSFLINFILCGYSIILFKYVLIECTIIQKKSYINLERNLKKLQIDHHNNFKINHLLKHDGFVLFLCKITNVNKILQHINLYSSIIKS